MARSSQQKLKILYVARALMEQTDEEHPMSATALIAYLHGLGIRAERKAIYDDIDTLRIFGMDVRNRRSRPAGFYIGSRSFDQGELRLLCDAVRSAEFISDAKSEQLCRKFEKLAGIHGAQQLRQPLFVEKRANALDEGIYDQVDTIRMAMKHDLQITFGYLEWTVAKKLRLKRNGERYRVSPWGIVWKEGNFYLVAIDEKSGIVKHYRIDKMQDVQNEPRHRSGADMFERFSAPEFSARTFGMFGGREETVTLEMENHFIGVLIDRFGEDVRIIPRDKEHFRALLRVHVSRQFFGWLAGLGPGVELVLSRRTRFEYQRFLRKSLEPYHDTEEESEQAIV